MAYSPKRPTGSTPEALFMQWMYDQIKALQPRKSPTVRFDRNKDGIVYHAAPGGSGGSPLMLCMITSLYGGEEQNVDYIGVTPWTFSPDDSGTDFTQEGQLTGSEFMCAKCVSGQQPASETIDSEEIDYFYSDDNTRNAVPQLTGTEAHVMHPRYMAYDEDNPPTDVRQTLVLVMRVQGGWTGVQDANGNNIAYIEVQPNRYWALAAS